MSHFLRIVAIGLLVILPFSQIMAQGKIVINEIMQSNVDFLMIDHDFPDSWVELYNGTGTRISIQNYRIGPTKVPAESFSITTTEEYLEPQGYLVFYCDKTLGAPLHCNFNLESGQGKLYLWDNRWHIIDSISYPKMPAPNVAYGRATDGDTEWQYELTPTPGAPNNSIECQDVLPEPLFSNEGHLMANGPESVSITMPEDVPADARIYLTLDGKEPTWDSTSDTHFDINIDKSTVIRAKLLSHQAHPCRSTTHSYIFHPRATNLPFVSIATDSAYLYSSEEGILSPDTTEGKPNYGYKWRRPANFEYFQTKIGVTVFNQSGEMAVSGASSRHYQQKSMKCYAKKRFGTKNFKGDFWRDKPNVNKVKSFVLRNGGTTCNYARFDDAFVHKLFGTHLDSMDWQAYEPVIVYINGQYKGIFGMRERSNEDYVTSNYGIEEDELEMATNGNYLRSNIHDTPYFNSFNILYHRDDVTYEEIAENIDVENFMNAFIAECYASNTDFPHNNGSMWRQTAENGCWHWIPKDLDHIFINNSSWNMFKYMLGTSDPNDQEYEKSNRTNTRICCFLYEKMMSFPEFRDHFIASYATYLGDFLRPDICVPIISEMEEEIIDEIPHTFAAYGNMSTLSKHQYGLDRLYNYVNTRPQFVYQQMADYFSLGNIIPVSIAKESLAESDETGIITMSNLPLRTGRFDGAWFTSFPLSLCSEAEDAAWVMTVTRANGEITSESFDTKKIAPDLSSCLPGDSVSFILTDANQLDSIPNRVYHNGHKVAAIYDVTGKQHQYMQKGLNVVAFADGKRQKIIRK